MVKIRMRTKKLLFSLFISTQVGYGAVCGACSGCASILPEIIAVAAELETLFEEAETRIAIAYGLKILIPLEENKLLKRELAVLKIQLEALEREKMKTNLEIEKAIDNIARDRQSQPPKTQRK